MASKMWSVRCHACHAPTRVLESRRAEDGAALRRRRECPSCGQRFTTYERREPPALYVRKRDGRREAFDRPKLRAGMLRAAYKRPVPPAAVEAIVDRIEAEAEASGGELDAKRVGDMCLEGLGEVDRVSYLQFAAVYKQFADVDEVRAELTKLAAATGSTGGPQVPGSVRGARQHPAAPVKVR
jgi:transcriptional repressor NrdR